MSEVHQRGKHHHHHRVKETVANETVEDITEVLPSEVKPMDEYVREYIDNSVRTGKCSKWRRWKYAIAAIVVLLAFVSLVY